MDLKERTREYVYEVSDAIFVGTRQELVDHLVHICALESERSGFLNSLLKNWNAPVDITNKLNVLVQFLRGAKAESTYS